MNFNLPIVFRQRMLHKLGEKNYLKFESSLSESSPTSIRLHPTKNNEDQGNLSQIPWCPLGKYLNERPSFTLDPAFHTGEYYVQESASMFIWHILDQCIADNKEIKILDLCASPGGKTSLIAAYLENKGLLVANEVIKTRAYTLKTNMIKEAYENVVITNNDPKDFGVLDNFFDIILVDAPCSGEGMFRKNHKAIDEWSEENAIHCAARQRRIIADVLPSLKENGYVIYSTCTYNDQENIDNLIWATKNLPLKNIVVECPEEWGIVKIEKEDNLGYQFYPHLVQSEGFFISLMQKTEATPKNKIKIRVKLEPASKSEMLTLSKWVQLNPNMTFAKDPTDMVHYYPISFKDEINMLFSYVRIIHCGITFGKITKDIVVPEHDLALYPKVSENIPRYELSKKEALLFLKKELNQIDSEELGWIIVTYHSNGIGWIKNIGSRLNNYLPNEWKIRMSLENN